ncbi:hypothetical protein JL107_15080 [Nakamurella flavida]|uniref:Uncharacterized protein n=1 Tax=Nakamurella flavida TaxID=363630 RepID=A0A938YR95_9ACTN|nr:hypothetical protein [Nakamurella flavida]MBM9477773.1 hypothetical protein [Nakamurella flavida]
MSAPQPPRDRSPHDSPALPVEPDVAGSTAGRLARRVTDGAALAWRRRSATPADAPADPAPALPTQPTDRDGDLPEGGRTDADTAVVAGRSLALQQLLDEYGPAAGPLTAGSGRPTESLSAETAGSIAAAAAAGTTAEATPTAITTPPITTKITTDETEPSVAHDHGPTTDGSALPGRSAADGPPARGSIATPRPLAAALHHPDAGSAASAPATGPAYARDHASSAPRHRRRPLVLAAAVAVALTAGIGVAASTLIGSTDATPAAETPVVRVLDTASFSPEASAPATTDPAGTTAAATTAPATPTAQVPVIIPTDAPTRPADTGSAVVSSLAPGEAGFGWPTTDPATG